MKAALRKGTYGDLNHYYLSDLGANEGDSLLGQCHFPVPPSSRTAAIISRDGCMIGAETMPGGKASP